VPHDPARADAYPVTAQHRPQPGGVPTIVAIDIPLGVYVRGDRLPDGRWRMAWRGFGADPQGRGGQVD
jgi:hypothetical protein